MQYAYVIHYDAPEWCRRTVASLRASDRDVAVVVVDNGGAALDLPPDVPVLRPGVNGGYTGGANTALRDWWRRDDATGPFVVCCHDLELSPGALSAMARALDSGSSGLGIVAPTVRQGGVEPHGAAGRLVVRGGEDVVLSEWVSGACTAISAECARALRGYDESFGSYVEDVELCLRARDLGWEVGRLVRHVATGQGSASSSWRRTMYVNNVRLALVRGGRRAAARRWLAHLTFALLQAARALRHHDADQRARATARLRALPAAAVLVVTSPAPRIPATQDR